MAPGPRCSGPGSVLGVPTLLPWTLPATPCTGTVPTNAGGTKGRDCHRCDEQWCHTGQRQCPHPAVGVVAWMWWRWVALPQDILVSRPSCQGGVVPRWDMPRASLPSAWLLVGIWLGGGCGPQLSASQSPVSCPVPIPTHGLEALDQY